MKTFKNNAHRLCERCGGKFHLGETVRKHRGGAVHNFPCSRVDRLARGRDQESSRVALLPDQK